MNPTQLDQMLGQLEHRFSALSSAVASNHIEEIELHSYGLQQLARKVPAYLKTLPPEVLSQSELKLRLKKLTRNLQHQREAVLRRSLSVERSLHILLPSLHNANSYAQGANRHHSARSANYQTA